MCAKSQLLWRWISWFRENWPQSSLGVKTSSDQNRELFFEFIELNGACEQKSAHSKVNFMFLSKFATMAARG